MSASAPFPSSSPKNKKNILDAGLIASLMITLYMEYKLQLLHAYDPASSHNNEKVNHLYEDIGLSLKKKKKAYYTIVLEDLMRK